MIKNEIFSYRLSNEETQLLNNLFEVYTKNGFGIDKWPEIYFCNYNEANVHFNLPKEEFNDGPNSFFNPDYLGIYTYETNKEGIVILFKDRIIKYAYHIILNNKFSFLDINQTITLLKTKVLVHEIGHWLTHACSIVNKKEIMQNYILLPKIIVESMAQLTVVWSFYKHQSKFEYLLENFFRLFTPMQPPPYYEFSKINHIESPEIILKRYKEIASKLSHLDETRLFEIFSKKEEDLSKIEIQILNNIKFQ